MGNDSNFVGRGTDVKVLQIRGTMASFPNLVIRAVISTIVLSASFLASAQQATPTQDEAKSVAEVATEAKKNKRTHTKKVITEEDLDKGPLPRLNMEGVDNSDEIITAIGQYHAKHTDAETEQVIHDWYDEYDSMLADAIHGSIEIRSRRESTVYNGYQLCQESSDYETCEKRRQQENRGARQDQFALTKNGLLSARIQQAFIRIRGGICRYNLRYDWFKVRNGNGNGSF
jgi:hypothetical protein